MFTVMGSEYTMEKEEERLLLERSLCSCGKEPIND